MRSWASPKLSINTLGPSGKGTSAPQNNYAQITFPCPTGDYLERSKSITSVSQAWNYYSFYYNI